MEISQAVAERFGYQGLLVIKIEIARVLNLLDILFVVDFVYQSSDLLSLFLDQIITKSWKKPNIVGDVLPIHFDIRKCVFFALMMDQFCDIASESLILAFVRNLNANTMKVGHQIKD